MRKKMNQAAFDFSRSGVIFWISRLKQIGFQHGKGAIGMKLLRFVLVWSCATAAVCGCACGDTATPDNTPSEQPARPDLSRIVLLDVRSPEEYAAGYLQGARNIPHDRIEEEIAAAVPDKSVQVILYCRSGRRAGTALQTMQAMGYENVSNYGGLEDAQERLGLPVVTE